MKKLLTILALSLFSLGAFAQLPFSLGVKVGITTSKFTTDNFDKVLLNTGDADYSLSDFETDAQNGFQIGLMSRLKFKKWFVQPEMYYSLKKGKVTASAIDVDNPNNPKVPVTQKVEMNNLDVPILLGYRLIDLKVVKLNLFTGPVASFQMKNAINFTGEVAKDGFGFKNADTDSKVDPEAEMKNANWNWQAGVGIDIAMLYLDVRHEWGLNNITKADFEQKSNMLTFTLGWKFF